MKVSRVKRRLLIILSITFFIVLILVFIGIKIKNGFAALNESRKEELPMTYQMSKEDSLLFRNEFLSEIKVTGIRNSKTRPSVAQLSYQNKYLIFIFLIDTTGQFSVKDSLRTIKRNVDRTTGIAYNIFDESYFRLQYKSGTLPYTAIGHFTFSGGSISEIEKNDSVCAYNLTCKNFSFRYKTKDPIDIFLETKQMGVKSSLSVTFKKNQNKTYLLIMAAMSSREVLPPQLLYSIIK